MALVSCPDCGNKLSDLAPACLTCGRPMAVSPPPLAVAVPSAAVYQGPPHNCRHCGGALKKGADAKSEGSGCLLLVVGLFLTPFLIGIPIALYGLHLGSKREGFWRCKKCHEKFPREIHWWELG
jgi:DNA-directed RNA polymerase subunit RPC12/RpoP